MGLDDVGWTGFQSGLSWLAVFADAPQSEWSSPSVLTSLKKGVTVIEGIKIEGIKVAGIKIEEIKTDESDGCVGSGFSVVTLSITAMPLFAAVLRQNACMLAAR
jgi:uncharacterized membrane protein YqjE